MYPGDLVGAVEGRRQQEHHLGAAPHQVGPHRVHGPLRQARRRHAREHGPGLGDGVDGALVALRRPERRAVVVGAAPVPLPVPGPPQRRGQPHRLGPVAVGAGDVAAVGAERREVGEHGVEEEAEPGALAAPLAPDPVHPVVPVAAPHERQAAGAGGEGAVEGQDGVLVERAVLGGGAGPRVGVLLAGLERRPLQERDPLVEHAAVAGGADVVRHGVGEPGQVVGAAGAGPLAARRVPPVLHVPLAELAPGRPQEVAPGPGRAAPAPGPWRPGAGRGSRRRRRAGGSRCAPTSGTPAPGRGASGS